MVAGLDTRSMHAAPIYTRDNCRFSFPLQWGLTLFWHASQLQAHWLEQLAVALEPDGIRILSHRFFDSTTSQFAISTKPYVSPQTIVHRVKGRLHEASVSIWSLYRYIWRVRSTHRSWYASESFEVVMAGWLRNMLLPGRAG